MSTAGAGDRQDPSSARGDDPVVGAKRTAGTGGTWTAAVGLPTAARDEPGAARTVRHAVSAAQAAVKSSGTGRTEEGAHQERAAYCAAHHAE